MVELWNIQSSQDNTSCWTVLSFSGSGGNDDVCEFDATTTVLNIIIISIIIIIILIITMIIIIYHNHQDSMVMTMGFETLPHNDAAALMNHLATKGEQSMMMILVVFKIFYCPRWCMTWLLKWWLWLIIDNDNNIKHWSGPLSASVAASDWSSYRGGVFDGCDYNGNMVLVDEDYCQLIIDA